MRRSIFKTAGLLIIVLLVAFSLVMGATVFKTVSKALFVPIATSMAQTASDTTAQTDEDTVKVIDADAEKIQEERARRAAREAREDTKKEGGLSIKIDESGIRIEGGGIEGEGPRSVVAWVAHRRLLS